MLFLLRRIRNGVVFSRAMKAAGDGQYSLSLRFLSEIVDKRGGRCPSEESPIVANILFAEMSEAINRAESATAACRVALKQLGDDGFCRRINYNFADRSYLKYRCKWILAKIVSEKEELALELMSATIILYSDLKISGTSEFIKKLFPITDEDGRALDDYVSSVLS